MTAPIPIKSGVGRVEVHAVTRRRVRSITLPPRQPQGMTMIELMAATLLAALMMTALLGVLRAMTFRQKALRDDRSSQDWQTRFTQRLEWDLVNSRRMRTSAEGFEMLGHAGRDFGDGASFHSPAIITYGIVTTAAGACLVRSERHLESLQLDNERRELVCTGVDRIAMTDLTVSKKKDSDAKETPRSANDWGVAIPNDLIVNLFYKNESKPVLSHAYTLR